MKSSSSEPGLTMLIKKRISKTCQNKGARTTFIVDKIIGESMHNPNSRAKVDDVETVDDGPYIIMRCYSI